MSIIIRITKEIFNNQKGVGCIPRKFDNEGDVQKVIKEKQIHFKTRQKENMKKAFRIQLDKSSECEWPNLIDMKIHLVNWTKKMEGFRYTN